MSYRVHEGHTFEQYDKKYGKKDLKVVNKVDADADKSLLEGKDWWVIDDKYYEVKNPLRIIVAWWLALAVPMKAVCCGAAAVVLALAVVLPIVLSNKNSDDEVEVGFVTLNCGGTNDDVSVSLGVTQIRADATNFVATVVINNNEFITPGWFVVAVDRSVDFQDEHYVVMNSEEQNNTNENTPYSVTVNVSDGINLLDYAGKALDVCFWGFN